MSFVQSVYERQKRIEKIIENKNEFCSFIDIIRQETKYNNKFKTQTITNNITQQTTINITQHTKQQNNEKHLKHIKIN